MSDTDFERLLCTENAERAHGSIVLSMWSVKAITLLPEKGVRLFANRLAGDVGIGYIALGEDGRRPAYLNHASYASVCAEQTMVAPPMVEVAVAARGLIMVQSKTYLPHMSAAADLPYDAFNVGTHVRPIVERLVEVCGHPEAVTIAPYFDGSAILEEYTRTMAVDVQPHVLGTFEAEGKRIL